MIKEYKKAIHMKLEKSRHDLLAYLSGAPVFSADTILNPVQKMELAKISLKIKKI